MELVHKYIQQIEQSVTAAEQYSSKIDKGVFTIEGFTGQKTLHFYNNLLGMDDVRYLEIGSWRGSSTCAALCGNAATAVCIENWSEFESPRDECLANVEKYRGDNTVYFIEQDCWKVKTADLPKCNIYLYDACHKRESHKMALTHYIDAMDDIFVYIVDDWDWKSVQDGTNDAIKELGLETMYKLEIHMKQDGSDYPESKDYLNWWNGICVFVFKKNML